MCGICGFYNLAGQPVDRQVLTSMMETLHHRGPDAQAIWCDAQVGLGHTRLAIIDLSADAAQPMGNENGLVWIIYNGEIYNYQSLRRLAADRGHQLFSHSDTETILHLYEDYGAACLDHLNGMFAFAIWDSPRQRLFLARDRVGKKPLYYYRDEKTLVFGSEIKALLAHPDVPRRLNHNAISSYLVYGYVPAPETIFADIYSLLPGHWMIVEKDQFTVRSYWDVPWTNPSLQQTKAEETYVVELHQHLRDAVRTRLVSDVPLGAFLSGGLDSSLIVALMTQLVDAPVKTFAIGFDGEPSFNELPYARRVAEHLGTDHHEFTVKPDAVELLPKLVYYYDQPFADPSAIPTFLVSQLTRQYVTVTLTGDGGDELLAGYERFAAAHLAELYRRVPSLLHRALSKGLHLLPESTSYRGFARRARRFVDTATLPLLDRYLGWVGLFDLDTVSQLLPSQEVNGRSVRDHLWRRLQAVQSSNITDQLLYLNATTYLPDDLLVKTDRASMAHGLEARCPFLDQNLVTWAATVPAHLKLRRLTTKYLLKKTARGLLPREVIHRPKHGFGAPLGRWFRHELRSMAYDILLDSRTLQRGFLDGQAVRALLDAHMIGQSDHGYRIWALLFMELWFRRYID